MKPYNHMNHDDDPDALNVCFPYWCLQLSYSNVVTNCSSTRTKAFGYLYPSEQQQRLKKNPNNSMTGEKIKKKITAT